MKNKGTMLFTRCIALLAMALLASGCAGGLSGYSARTVHDVTVNFSGDCPSGVSDPELEVERGDRVRWRTDGDPEIEFWIVFDPFVGKSIRKRAGATEVISPPIRNRRGQKAPLITYKYSIVVEEDENQEPRCVLDPRFIVSK